MCGCGCVVGCVRVTADRKRVSERERGITWERGDQTLLLALELQKKMKMKTMM
jgi:hypothetical protein